jgi:signal transduction histidine kinase
LREDEQLVESVCAAAGLAMENERLQAQLRSRLEELSASRTRILEAAQAERRRIERDLHDGSQQRLVSVAMTLGLVDSKLGSDPDRAHTYLSEARTGLSEALEDLRELSSGIHPGILTERGLAPALDELAARAHLPVQLVVSLPGRLPDKVETAAYFVVSEALTNVGKHAPAATVRVGVDLVGGRLVIEVQDDGAGGADPSRGSGLNGLRDRVEALGGHLTLQSPPGAGTQLEVEIPCAS